MKINKRVIVAGVLILFLIFLRFSGITKFFSFDMFKNNKEQLLFFVSTHYFYSVFVYIISYILIVISTLPLAGLLTVVSGFLFGAIFGTIYSVLAGTIGATISFLIFRHLLGKYIQKKYSTKLENFNKNINQYGGYYILIINFITLIPFFIVNSLASLTNIPLKTFIWTTAIGIIPGSFVYAFAGKELGRINSLKDIFSTQVLIAFVMLGLIALLPLIIRKFNKNA